MLGTVLANRYSLSRVIGSGGMGDIYEARRLADGARVAVKVLREELAQEPEAVTRFHREVRAAAALKSRFAARILDFGEGGKHQPFMVMEYLEGRDLMAEIEARGAIPFVEAARYLMQACEAMAEAHQLGIVHRDLKPPNLFLAQEGGARTLKVLDFGISKANRWGDAHITSTKMSFGSPLYMSPEQIRSTKLVDARSDVWSLGVIFYEAVTGEPPFVADTPGGLAVIISVDAHVPATTRNPALPKRVDDIVASALQKDPSVRMQSVHAMYTALSELVREAGATEPPIEPQPSSSVRSIGSNDRRAITLGPATTDPPVEGGANERLGRLAAAVLIPFGAIAVVVTIWLFVSKGGTPPKVSAEPQRVTSSAPVLVSAPAPVTMPNATATPTPTVRVDLSVTPSAPTGTASSSAGGRGRKPSRAQPTSAPLFVPSGR